MKALQAYIKAWGTLFRNKRMWGIFYLANLGLAFLAAIPVSGFLGNNVGHSLSLKRSVEEFDYLFLNELMNEYGALIRSILDQSLLFTLLFLLLSVFMVGGFLYVLKKDQERFSFVLFLIGCSKYFWRMLRVTIYFLLIQVFVLFLFFSFFSLMVDGLSPFEMESERQLTNSFMILGPIYLLAFTIISMIHDYTKIHIVHKKPKWLFGTFWEGFKITFQNFRKFFFLYFLNILTFFLGLGIYYMVKGIFGTETMLAVFLTFFIGQIFIFFRIGIKLLNLSNATYLYKWTREGYNH